MPKRITPITVYCKNASEAARMAARDGDSKALMTGAGTLAFHMLIAQHGAGEFTTLYVPAALKGSFREPVGGLTKNTLKA